MNNDRQIVISTSGSRKATHWPASTLWWSELVTRLQTPVRSTETLQEYLQYSKTKQDELKDVGGFVAGAFTGSRRKANEVAGRDVITLDLDNVPPGQTDDILRRLDGLGCSFAVYSTRKHEPGRPRLRVLLLLNRTVTAEEYEPIARMIGQLVGIELCDPTTFEASRLMYWPSCCSDSQYVYHYADKPLVAADGILGMYTDWRDISSWPEVPGAPEGRRRLAAKQGDPLDKSGIVGAFCKAYDVEQAIAKYLSDKYVPCDILPGRYTYLEGSTSGGLVIYDDAKFAFSHHATDPAGGKLCNSFDLVRLHLFNGLDDDAKPDTPTNRLPSFSAMCQLASQDEAAARILNTERYETAVAEFSAIPLPASPEAATTDTDWMQKLKVSPVTGQFAKTVDNVLIILNNDPLLKDKLAFDEFANRGLALDALPWDPRNCRRDWKDVDDAGLRHYIEAVYGIGGKERIYDAAALCSYQHRFNDVKNYLDALTWDGVKRLDTLLIDYFGAEDSVYTRAAIRKALAAAVARVYCPGTKFDYMLILAGPQGCGKSTFLAKLGKSWYSDSLTTFEGKEASELLQGVWINEVGELNGMSRAEVNSVKQFLSRLDDIFREPYGRRTARFPRRCVFFGTTNDSEFLRDRTGNRRFWPVDLYQQAPTKSVFVDLDQELNQIWAEAVVVWRLGERLFLRGEEDILAQVQQELHRESNAKEGLIREFLERPITPDWDKKDLLTRRVWWSGEFGSAHVDTVRRDKVCALEIWCECFGGDSKMFDRRNAVEINGIMDGLKDWKRTKNGVRFGRQYGFQKGYERHEY